MATQIFFHVHLFTPTWWNDPIWRAYFLNGLVQPPNSINTSRRLESAPGPDTPRRNSALKAPWDLSWQLTPNSLVTSLGTHICIFHSIILLLQDFHFDLLWAWLWLLWSGKWKSFLVKQCWIWDKQLHFRGFGWYAEWDHFYESMTVCWMDGIQYPRSEGGMWLDTTSLFKDVRSFSSMCYYPKYLTIL